MKAYLYTAVTGNRDKIRTDIPCHTSYGKFHEPALNAKIYKVLPHLFFQGYEVFMWVDANVELKHDVEYYIDKYLGDADVALIKHPFRSSVADEAAELRTKGYYPKISELDEQVKVYGEIGFDDDRLFECNVIIRRNTDKVNTVFERWWAHITRWQYRDQISLPFVLKYFPDLKVNVIDPSTRTNPDFVYNKHIKALPEIKQPTEHRVSNNPLISIIIITFGKWYMTKNCLDSLFAAGIKQDFEVIVVDNGSEDETIDELKRYPGLRVFINTPKSHFSHGCNTGAYHAKGEYLLFLNNDTIIEKDFMTPMLSNFSNKNIGIVGAKCLYPDRTVQHCGIAIKNNYNIKHIFQGYHESAGETNIKRKYQCVTAACMMVRKKVFHYLNGFDTNYRTGWEDIDLCLRAGKAGLEIQYEPAAQIIHIGHQSEGRGLFNRENKKLYRKTWVNKIRPDIDSIVAHANKVVRECK